MRLLLVSLLSGLAVTLSLGCGTTAIETGTGGSGGMDGGDPCGSLTCMNGGMCVDVGGTAECDCASGYNGDECENDIDECPDDDLEPCDPDNTASCDGTMPAGSYTCVCKPGYDVDDDCETDIDECPDDDLGLCDETGTATCDGTMPPGSYTCMCNDGYEGDNCETDTDECPDDSLGSCDADNTASCDGTTPPGSYTCTCNTGYAGMDCDECDDGYEMVDGECVLVCPGGEDETGLVFSFVSLTPSPAASYENTSVGAEATPVLPQLVSTAAGLGSNAQENVATFSNGEGVIIQFYQVDGGVLDEAENATDIVIKLTAFKTVTIDAEDKDGVTLTGSPKTVNSGPTGTITLNSELPGSVHKLTLTEPDPNPAGWSLENVTFTHECLGFDPAT